MGLSMTRSETKLAAALLANVALRVEAERLIAHMSSRNPAGPPFSMI
jgi:hypothetical protein